MDYVAEKQVLYLGLWVFKMFNVQIVFSSG